MNSSQHQFVARVDELLRWCDTPEAQLHQMPGLDEEYFVVHTPSTDLTAHQPGSTVIFLAADRLAKLVVPSGLSEWLTLKTL